MHTLYPEINIENWYSWRMAFERMPHNIALPTKINDWLNIGVSFSDLNFIGYTPWKTAMLEVWAQRGYPYDEESRWILDTETQCIMTMEQYPDDVISNILAQAKYLAPNIIIHVIEYRPRLYPVLKQYYKKANQMELIGYVESRLPLSPEEKLSLILEKFKSRYEHRPPFFYHTYNKQLQQLLIEAPHLYGILDATEIREWYDTSVYHNVDIDNILIALFKNRPDIAINFTCTDDWITYYRVIDKGTLDLRCALHGIHALTLSTHTESKIKDMVALFMARKDDVASLSNIVDVIILEDVKALRVIYKLLDICAQYQDNTQLRCNIRSNKKDMPVLMQPMLDYMQNIGNDSENSAMEKTYGVRRCRQLRSLWEKASDEQRVEWSKSPNTFALYLNVMASDTKKELLPKGAESVLSDTIYEEIGVLL